MVMAVEGMEKQLKVEALLETLGTKNLGKEGTVPHPLGQSVTVERVKTLEELKVLGRVAENADPIFTANVA